MDPSINRPAGTGVTAVTEEKGGNRDQMRGPIMSVCVREESGVGVACQEVSVHTDLIGLSVSPCLLALPPVTLTALFCCVGRLGESCRGQVKDSDSRSKLGGGGGGGSTSAWPWLLSHRRAGEERGARHCR